MCDLGIVCDDDCEMDFVQYNGNHKFAVCEMNRLHCGFQVLQSVLKAEPGVSWDLGSHIKSFLMVVPKA